MSVPYTLIQLKRTNKLLTDSTFNGVIPKFGEPVFSHNSTKDEMVIGDGILDIPHLPRLNLTALNTIVSGNGLAVQYGGTGRNTLPAGEVLVGDGTNPVTTRSVTDQTTAGGDVTANNNFVTANTLVNYKGSTNQNTVGTITTGTWNGSTIDVAHGGTGKTTLASGEVLLGNGTNGVTTRPITDNVNPTAAVANTNLVTQNTLYNAIPKINGVHTYTSDSSIFAPTTAGTKNRILVSSGSGAPTWLATAEGAAYVTSADGALTFGTLAVGYGGTGFKTTTTVNAVVIGNSSNAANAMQTVATANGAFYAESANGKPKFGILPIAQGGTGQSTAANAWTALGGGSIGKLNSISSDNINSLAASKITGTLSVEHGGTGIATATNLNGVVIGNSSSATGNMQTVATADGAFYATSANGKPQFGTLPVKEGGTGATSFTANSIVIGNGTNALSTISVSNLLSNNHIPVFTVNQGAPTTSTSGKVGDWYYDKQTWILYICTAVSGSTYTWQKVAGVWR